MAKTLKSIWFIIWEKERKGENMGRVLPILFNTDMVRAILAGRKKVTRRATKGIVPFDNDGKYWNILRKGEWTGPVIKEVMIRQKAPYQPGDILYVRETWGWGPCWDCGMDTEENNRCYEKAERTYNQKKHEWGCYYYKASMPPGEELYVDTWHPSIHMPKEAARIWLKVTDVRCKRLQDMSLDDFLAEGICPNPEAFNDPENAYAQAKTQFINIWDSTIKKSEIGTYGWEANPWVWVIEFEQCEKPRKDDLNGK